MFADAGQPADHADAATAPASAPFDLAGADAASAPALDAHLNPHGVLLFGGESASETFPDTWLWDGSRWTQVPTGNGPSARSGATMTMLAGEIVMFGGQWGGNPLAETWQWNGKGWVQMMIAGPSKRWGAAMAASGATAILYGGLTDTDYANEPIYDSWQWNGSGWAAVGGSTPKPTAASWLCDRMAALRSDVILPGASTWKWDGTSWSVATKLGPPQATSCAVAAVHDKLLLLAGTNGASQTWLWDGQVWSQLVTPAPSMRCDAAIATEPSGDVLLFGGRDGCGNDPLGDSWEFDGSAWHELKLAGPQPRYGAAMTRF